MGKYRKLGKKKLDPRKVTVRRVRSEKAVEGYMANPDWKGPDRAGNGGDPSVLLCDDGSYAAWVGNHRIEAAARTGRTIEAVVWVEKGSAVDPGWLRW